SVPIFVRARLAQVFLPYAGQVRRPAASGGRAEQVDVTVEVVRVLGEVAHQRAHLEVRVAAAVQPYQINLGLDGGHGTFGIELRDRAERGADPRIAAVVGVGECGVVGGPLAGHGAPALDRHEVDVLAVAAVGVVIRHGDAGGGDHGVFDPGLLEA